VSAPVTVTLYARDGSSLVTTVDDAAGVQWLDELNSTGSGTVKVPISSDVVAAVGYDQVLKFTYEGSDRFAIFIESIGWNVVDEAGDRWLNLSGRGLLGWLANAAVLPVGGMTKSVADVRWFNFGAVDAPDHDLHVTWSTPEAVKWDVRDDNVAGYPLDWPDIAAYWLWPTDPEASVAAGTKAWFRASFTLARPTSIEIWAAADNFLDLYLDGELLISQTSDPYGWQTATTTRVELPSGTHVIAVRGQNAIPPPTIAGYNPAAILVSLLEVDGDGSLGGSVLHTDTSWECASEEPWWSAGDVLRTLVLEAQTRDVDGVTNLTMDFDAETDSNGQPWSTKVARSWDIVNTSVLTVAQDLAELGVDVWITPDLVLHCAETRGSVLAGDVVLSDDTSVARWSFAGERATGTHGWIRNDQGWTEVVDSGGEAAWGRREVGMSLGASDSDEQAADVVRAAFREIAVPQETVQDTELIPADGARAYVNFDVADTVTGIDKDGSPANVRVLSITLVQDDDAKVVYTPELEVMPDETS
jgi:hypothetical protein